LKGLKSYSPGSVVKQVFSGIRALDFAALWQHRDLLELVKSTPYETEQVMGYLKYQPESWVVLHEGHPWYKIAESGANTLLRNSLLVGHPIFLYHLESRWLLIVCEGEVIPAIFLFTEHARSGIAVSFYRVFGGAAISPTWMALMKELVTGVILASPPEVLELDTPTPHDSLYQFKGIKWMK
jgi:hypothetical protein